MSLLAPDPIELPDSGQSWAEPIRDGVLICWSCGHRMPGFPDEVPKSVACVRCRNCGATIWIWREPEE